MFVLNTLMKNEDQASEVIDILRKVGAVMSNGHFVGVSGLHMDTYINKDFLYPHTGHTRRLGEMFAERYKDKNIEVVVGPALGGIILSQWTAFALTQMTGRDVLGVYTEKSPIGGQVLTRGYEKFVKGKRILVVEDIVTTGGSLEKTVQAVNQAGGDVVAICALINKSEVFRQDFLCSISVPTYPALDCPMCKSGIPIDQTVAHGKKFQESKE